MASENGSWSKRDRNELLHLRQLVTQPTDTFSETKWETHHHLHIIILRFLCLFKRKRQKTGYFKKRTKTKARTLAKTKRSKLKVVGKTLSTVLKIAVKMILSTDFKHLRSCFDNIT